MSAVICLIATLFIVGHSLSKPYFVTYVDFPTCATARDAACLANMGVPGYASHSYNVVNLAFYVPDKNHWLADATAVWNDPGAYMTSAFKSQLTGSSTATAAQLRSAIKQKFTDAGVKLLLSVFGGTSHPMASFSESSLTGSSGLVNRIADIVTEQLYDGVDIDFEQTSYFQSGTAESWLCTLTNGLRARLGSSYIITHAPQAPYMGASYSANNPAYPNGAYLKVEQECGTNIDWYNVQFYNQGGTTYDSFSTLFTASNGWSGTTAVYQIIQGQNYNGGLSVPADKIVVGKFIRAGVDGSAGWISGPNMKTIFETAIARSSPVWNTGFMTWQYIGDKDTNNFAWSNTVASAWGGSNPAPVSAPVNPPVSIPSTATPTARPTDGGNSGGGGGGGYIGVTILYESAWWMTVYLTNTNGVSVDTVKLKADNSASYLSSGVQWTHATLGPIYGFSVDPNMRAPFSIKMVSSSGQTISSSDVIGARAVGATGTMTQSFGSSYTENDDDDDDKISWAVWVAVVLCLIVIIGCIVGFIYYKKNKEKKEVTFDHGDKNRAADIEIADGAANTETQA